jgi:hypothetical protein
MSAVRIGSALLEKLGEPASAELTEILDGQRGATEAVVREGTERFERRLVEENSKIRLEMGAMRSDLRTEIGELRCEMRQGFADLRRDMASDRFELLKWAFLFWVGQLASISAIVGLLLRTIPAR